MMENKYCQSCGMPIQKQEEYITLTKDTIDIAHICCGFADKKCKESYELKKTWLRNEFNNGYVFRRLDERAKVFIEYVPAEKAWIPVDAPGYLMIGCFWVSGQYKEKGHGKALLQSVIEDAKSQGKNGVVAVVGTKKFHFMSDTKWLLKHGFETIETLPNGFSLLALKLNPAALNPSFKACVKDCCCPKEKDLVVYYTNRCPFTEYYVNELLEKLAEKKGISVKIVKLETMEQAQSAPTPATIFTVFYKGKFVTTDLSICTESRFDKMLHIE